MGASPGERVPINRRSSGSCSGGRSKITDDPQPDHPRAAELDWLIVKASQLAPPCDNSTMSTSDSAVSIHPYFKVAEGKLEEAHAFCEKCVAATTTEPGCLHYGFSFLGNEAHCRESYANAEGLLAHLDNVGALLGEFLETCATL